MKIIENKFIPFKGFVAINLFGILFIRKGTSLRKYTLNHEKIHTTQMKELLYIFFYLWYLIEWIVKLFQNNFNNMNAYRNISFEKEAFQNQGNQNYLQERKRYSFLNYLN